MALARKVMKLRKEHPALRLGGMRIIRASGSVLVFEREYGGERVLCVFNLGTTAREYGELSLERHQVLQAVGGASLAGLPGLSGLIVRIS